MHIEETQVTLRKLIASEGKVLRQKNIELDEEGNEIPRSVFKEIYLAITDNPENYEEVAEEIKDNN